MEDTHMDMDAHTHTEHKLWMKMKREDKNGKKII